MRFELSKSTPPHLNRGLQLRMLSFVVMFGIGLFVFNTLQPPQKVPERNRISSRRATVAEAQLKEGAPPNLRTDDTVLMGPDEVWKEPPPADAFPDEARAEREFARREVSFDKKYLSQVMDNTLGIRSKETDAFYRLLDHARLVPFDELEQAALTDVQYINLMLEPNDFRGEPIRIRGDLFRIRKFPASPNPQGIKTLYEAWIFTADSDFHPYRVICTSIPNDLALGEDLRKPVQVVGYFFKREGYASKGGMHVAPTLLANRIQHYWPPNAPPSTDAIVPYMIGFVTAVGLAFLVTLVSFSISDRRAAQAILRRKMNRPAPSFDGIESDFVSVKESLRILEEEEWSEADDSNGNAAAALQARDRVSSQQRDTEQGDEKKKGVGPSEAQMAERRRIEAEAVHNWTAHQQNSGQSTSSSRFDERERERREVDQVLSRLESTESETPITDQSTNESNSSSKHWGTIADGMPRPPLESEFTGNGYSKLAAWEQEIEQISSSRTEAERSGGMPVDVHSAQLEIERDRIARERELNTRLRNERAELDRQQRLREDQQTGQHHGGSHRTADGHDLSRNRQAYERSRTDQTERTERDRQQLPHPDHNTDDRVWEGRWRNRVEDGEHLPHDDQATDHAKFDREDRERLRRERAERGEVDDDASQSSHISSRQHRSYDHSDRVEHQSQSSEASDDDIDEGVEDEYTGPDVDEPIDESADAGSDPNTRRKSNWGQRGKRSNRRRRNRDN